MTDRAALRSLIDTIVGNIEASRPYDTPFYHLEFDKVFPDDIYQQMISAMPVASDYRPLPGRNGGNLREDGTSTRVKIDLFPEYIRHLPEQKRDIWDLVGRALTSAEVQTALMEALAPGLKRRFGDAHCDIGMYPIPVLTRDIPGYRITPHTDTKWKGMTIQFYLPKDDKATQVGTIFHGQEPDGTLTFASKMKFAPNTGYAFAVGDNTWHSADPVDDDVESRDSILLTYFVDSGLLRFLRNRGKRVGNLLLNEVKYLTR